MSSFHDGPIHTVVGLQMSTGKFVNVEKFNDQLSAVAPALKSKQTFRVELAGGIFYLKTWTNKYLSCSDLGVVTASAEARGKNEGWEIQFANGPVYIKSAHGKYLTPSGDTIKATAAAPTASEAICMLFAVHPQVCLRNFEDRFMMTLDDSNIASPNHYQMGVGTLFTLVYVSNGLYALWSGLNGKFAQVDGSGNMAATGNQADPSCCFAFEWVDDKVAIKSASTGKYLTVEGTNDAVKAKRDRVAQREKWEILDSHAQVTLLAHNGKYIGHQQITVICNQTEARATETFLLETEGEFFALRTSDGKFISHKDGSIKADGEGRQADTIWALEYPAAGRISFKTPDGKYLAAKPLGGVYLKGAADNETVFTVQLLNRPVIALMSSAFNTFVGSMNGKLVTHKATVETFSLEYDNGLYAFRTGSGEYFSINGGNVIPGQREWFEFHYKSNSRVAIRSVSSGKYLAAEQHGGFITSNNQHPSLHEFFEI